MQIFLVLPNKKLKIFKIGLVLIAYFIFQILNWCFFLANSSVEVRRPVLSSQRCPKGEVLHVDGKCTKPIINRRLFYYSHPHDTRLHQPFKFPSTYKIYKTKPRYYTWRPKYKPVVHRNYGTNIKIVPAKLWHSHSVIVNEHPINHQKNLQLFRFYSLADNMLVPLRAEDLLLNRRTRKRHLQDQDLQWQNTVLSHIQELMKNNQQNIVI